MALGDGKAKKETEEIRDELAFILDAVTSIGDKLITSFEEAVERAEELGDSMDVTARTLKRGLVADTKQAVKNTEELVKAATKAEKGILKQSEVQKLQNKLAETQLLFETRKRVAVLNKIPLTEQETKEFEKQIGFQKKLLERIEANNELQRENLSLFDLLKESAGTFADKIDSSGTLTKILSGELSKTQQAQLELSLIASAFAAALLRASGLVTDIQKQTALSVKAATALQKEFASLAINSEKAFITSKGLNESFLELTKQTGFIADFGGDILETQTSLTKVLKLSVEQAGKLSILSRLQGENTEKVLEDTVKTIGALSDQNKVGLDVKGILEEIGQVSAAIAVSLGENPVEIAKAITQAKLLGLTLSEVDGIASSLLDFESSITNELQAELLIGKDINLEKARQLALNNDLAGLSEEIRNNEEIQNAFITGNRIQQEAAANAIGIQREELAKIVMQQQLAQLGAENFKATYGEVAYQGLLARSASESFNDALDKVKSSLADIVTGLTPIINGIASLVSNSSVLTGIMAGIATLSFVRLIGSLAVMVSQLSAMATAAGAVAAFTNPAKLALGIAGAVAAASIVGGLIAKANTPVTTEDDMIMPPGYGDRILSTPKGSIALNNQDTIIAGTNLGGNRDNTISRSDNSESKRTNQLLEMILNKQGTVKMNATNVGTAFAMNTYEIQ